jgi:hypothetical protein
MRILTATLLGLLCLPRPARAQAPASPEARYQDQKKSLALAMTLEGVCPIAGAGALYAGDGDRAGVLAILSAAGAGAAVGSAFYLIHLSHQNPTGAGRVLHDVESVSAWTGLVGGAALYLLTRISGLAFAPDAVTAFNVDLQQRLGVPPSGPAVPFHAQAMGLSLTWRF